MVPPTCIHYPRDLPLPLKTRDSIIAALMAKSAIQELDKRLLATCEATGWIEAMRQRTQEILRTMPSPSFEKVKGALMAEVWEGYDRQPSTSNSLVGVRIPKAVMTEGIEVVREALDKIMHPDEEVYGIGAMTALGMIVGEMCDHCNDIFSGRIDQP